MKKLLRWEEPYYGNKKHFWTLMRNFGEGVKG